MNDTWLRFGGGSLDDLKQFLLRANADTPIQIGLSGNDWEPAACATIAVMSGGLDLRVISLTGTCIGDSGVEALTGTGALATTRTLSIERSGLTDTSLALLAACPDLVALRELYLCNRGGLETGIPNNFTDVGGVVLASSPHLAGLEELDLWETGIGDATLDALLISPGLPRLTSLNVWATRVTSAGVTRARAANDERWNSTRSEPHPAPSCHILSDYDDRVIDYST